MVEAAMKTYLTPIKCHAAISNDNNKLSLLPPGENITRHPYSTVGLTPNNHISSNQTTDVENKICKREFYL